MSGHNKWTQIKRQKAKTDGQKSKIFGKFAKLITQEARRVKGNINDPSLKSAIEKARSYNMPNDSIERAIKKAVTDNNSSLENIVYEAYGPGGCALIIEALTDNRNKAAQEVKHILSEFDLSLAGPGSASWAFQKTKEGWIPQTTMKLALEHEQQLTNLMEKLEENDEVQEVYTNAE